MFIPRTFVDSGDGSQDDVGGRQRDNPQPDPKGIEVYSGLKFREWNSDP